jgi:outer membrane receptor protein involved in Fe transport
VNTPNALVEFDGTREVHGVFAGATFTWKEMAIIDGTIRRDKASTLPKANNVYYYPSVSVGFVFSKLLPQYSWLTYAKLRANYAEVGNDAPIYSVNDVYLAIPPFGAEPQTSVTGAKNNPDLVPERTRSYEAGLEVALLKSRAGFDVTAYNAKSVDQIMPVIVSTATGYSSKFLNAGTVENKGIEVSAYGTPVQTQNFSWTINVNFARNRNKVVKLFEGADNLVLADFQGGVSLNASLGQPYGEIRGSDYVYFTDGNKSQANRVVGANGRYLVSPNANNVIGNANPDWTGGVMNTFKFKISPFIS